ncbi:MAG: pyridoxal phosphate-dependent aminotransferase [Spirochaetales bacterium]|nr:pyridoxal phosphate-dependent aminotransferase [Spirochaetales bacterium]
MKEINLSAYGKRNLIPAPVSRMLGQFAHDFRDGIDINLGIGYVNEETIPADFIVQALEEVVKKDSPYRQPLNYGSPQGSPQLISALRSYYLEKEVGGVNEDVMDAREIVIGSNGATSLLEAFSDLMEKGIVITAEPLYYIYTEFLERKGFTILTVPEDKDGMIPEKLEALLNRPDLDPEDISYAYVITVNNPSGSILTNSRRKEIVRLFTEFSKRRNRPLPVIFDKAYEDLVHNREQEKPLSGMLYDELGIIYEIGTLSKVIAPALRMGYMIAPPGDLLNSIIQKISDTGFSAPLINQEVASWLLDNRLEEQLAFVNEGYRKKAALLRPAIEEKLGPWLEECIGGSAGFYFYLSFKEIKTGEDSPFFKYLNRITGEAGVDRIEGRMGPRVIYIPGDFCVHPQGELREKGSRSLRLSYGYESTENFLKSLDLMAQAVQWVKECDD